MPWVHFQFECSQQTITYTPSQPSCLMLLNGVCSFLKPHTALGHLAGGGEPSSYNECPATGTLLPTAGVKVRQHPGSGSLGLQRNPLEGRSLAIRERRWEGRKGGEQGRRRDWLVECPQHAMLRTQCTGFLLSESFSCTSPRAQEVVESILAP